MKPREFVARIALAVGLLCLALSATAQPLVKAYSDNPKIKWINLGGTVSQYPYDSSTADLRTIGPCTDCPTMYLDLTAATGKLHRWTGRYALKLRDTASGSVKFTSHPRLNLKRNYSTGVHRTLIDMRLSSTNEFLHTIDLWFEMAEGIDDYPHGASYSLNPGIHMAQSLPAHPDWPDSYTRLPIVTGGDGVHVPELTTTLLAPFTLHTSQNYPFETTVTQLIQSTRDPIVNSGTLVRWYTMDRVPRIVQLVNKNSGRCMTVVSGDHPQGARVRQGDCNSPTNTDRAFHFYLPATVDMNDFFVEVAKVGGDLPVMMQSNYKGRCVDLPNESIVQNEKVVTGQCTTHDSQRWYLKVVNFTNNKPVITLRNGNSGFCLGVENGSTAQYAAMVQATCQAANTSQQWSLQLTTDNR